MSSEATLRLVKEEENDPNKRRLSNWLAAFEEFTVPFSESPRALLHWTGLFTMASVLRRNVKIPRSYLKNWECFPFIYTIFVGEQGEIKKSSSIGYAEKLLDHLQDLNLSSCPQAVTVPELMKRLSEAGDSSVYMMLSEFSLLPLKAGFGIYDVLTALFDGAKKIDEGTLGRGYILAANPCLNLCAATTPKWIAANVSEDVLGGGFGSRVIFINEPPTTEGGLFWNEKIAKSGINLEQREEDLVHDLRILSTIQGEFEIPGSIYDVNSPMGFMEDWYSKNRFAPKGIDSRMKGFYARRPAYVFKLAMLYHLSYSNELILSKQDFEDAIEQMKYIEKKVESTFKNIGKNPYNADMKGILQYIKDNPLVKMSMVKAQFQYAAEPKKLEELILGLKDAGLAEYEYDEKSKDFTCKAL